MEGDHDEHGFGVPPNLVTTFKLHRQGTSTSNLSAADAPPPPSWPDLLAQARLKQYRAREALPPRFHAAVCDGIPAAHRAEAWLLLTGAGKRLEEQPAEYAHLLEEGRRVAAEGSSEEDVEEQIDRDLHRTFPGHPSLTPSFIATVKDVLLAYSQRNPEVAYCQVRHRVQCATCQVRHVSHESFTPSASPQGMNFVCAAILMFVSDAASAFWLMCYIVEEVLVDHYVQSMIGHQVDTQVRLRS